MSGPRPTGRWRRRTPAWAREGAILKDNATLGDVSDEARTRQRDNRLQWAAIAVTSVLSIWAFIATYAQTSAETEIAALERARDRDEKRVVCTERYWASNVELAFLGIQAAQPEYTLDIDVLRSGMLAATDAATACAAAGLVATEASGRFGRAIEGMSSFFSSESDKYASTIELLTAMDEYIEVDIVALADLLETPTGTEE